jgi:hypothetical protein
MNRYTVILLLAVLGTHFFSKVSYITDSRWTLHSAWAIVHQHNLQLDRFQPAIEQNHYYAIEEQNGHLYYTFPPGTPLLCAPLLAGLELISKNIFYTDLFSLIWNGYSGGIEKFLAAIFVALASVFLYLVLRQWQVHSGIILISIVLFAFGTSAWSTASRGLFAHGPSMLFLLLGLWSLNKSEQNNWWLFVAGFVFSYAYVIRPTNSVSLLVFGLYVLYRYRQQSWRFIVSSAFVLGLFVYYNYMVYHNILSNYYLPSHIGNNGNLFKGLAGNLFSPSRGLLIYSPAFILLLPAVYYLLTRKKRNALVWALLAVVVLHTYVISSFNNWYAGWCFGARYFAEAIPYMVCLLALGFNSLADNHSSRMKNVLLVCFILLTAISCYINYRGANNLKTFEWNYSPNSIDENRNRVWDWNDPQFMRK